MEGIFDEVRAMRYHKGETVFCESVGEYTLPDYLPEIRKLLRIETKLLPVGQFVGNNKAEFSGMAVHTVLYSDDSGKLASTVLDGDYRFVAPISADGEVQAMADSRVDRVTYRLSGPRRLSIRASIASDVRLPSEESVVSEGLQEHDGTFEKLIGHEVISETMRIHRDDLTYSDSYRFDSLRADEVRPIASSASVFVKEAKPQADGVYCMGEIWVKLLYAVGGENSEIPEVLWRKVPFDTVIEANTPFDFVTIKGICTALDAAVEDDGLGACELTLSMQIALEGEGVSSREMHYVKDMYAKGQDAHIAYRQMPLFRTLGSVTQNFTVSGSAPLENNYPGARAVDCAVTLGTMTVERVDDKIRVSGECKGDGIMLIPATGEEAPQYERVELAFPVRMELDGKGISSDAAAYHLTAEFLGGQMRIDGENIRVDGEMAVTLSATEPKTISVAESAELLPDTAIEKPQGLVIVAYPESGETLWSMAKRYKADISSLAHCNQIPERYLAEPDAPGSIDGMTSLIIA